MSNKHNKVKGFMPFANEDYFGEEIGKNPNLLFPVFAVNRKTVIWSHQIGKREFQGEEWVELNIRFIDGSEKVLWTEKKIERAFNSGRRMDD